MFLRICIVCLALATLATVVVPQQQAWQQRRAPRKTITRPQPQAEPTPPSASPEVSPETSPAEEQQTETLKIDTNLVTVPVIASSVQGNYIPDLKQQEFSISEDGQKQEVAFFATVSAPFHVVLLLDTSASTQDKLRLIQQAAVTFIEQLQGADRVKVISFDDEVRELSEFTNDRAKLKAAINNTVSGHDTKVYDAFDVALASIKTIRGRKAIVLFSDGVDWRSDQATFDSTLHWLDEEGVVVYPIRYETRAETNAKIRN